MRVWIAISPSCEAMLLATPTRESDITENAGYQRENYAA
jgi:hypothetical protein